MIHCRQECDMGKVIDIRFGFPAVKGREQKIDSKEYKWKEERGRNTNGRKREGDKLRE